jgi:hypothetical protein
MNITRSSGFAAVLETSSEQATMASYRAVPPRALFGSAG